MMICPRALPLLGASTMKWDAGIMGTSDEISFFVSVVPSILARMILGLR